MGSKVTGYRTWEGALHLASYLTSAQSSPSLIKNKSVLELGAGTGFLSILCAKYLSAKSVIATDGDESVVEAIKTNAKLNSVEVEAKKLWWGTGLNETGLGSSYDVVVGADIVCGFPRRCGDIR